MNFKSLRQEARGQAKEARYKVGYVRDKVTTHGNRQGGKQSKRARREAQRETRVQDKVKRQGTS